MILFVTVTLLMLTGVLLVLLLPLFPGSRRTPENGRDAYDRTVYRDQLGEIDNDLERGLFTAQEAEAARIEIQRRMLAAEPAANPAAAAAPAGSGRTAAAAAVLLLPAAAVVLYLDLGRPGVPDAPLTQRTTEIAATAGDSAAMARAGTEHIDTAQLTMQLAKRLESDPTNAEGWNLLARSYTALERFTEAAEAYAQAAANNGRHPDTLSAWGEALMRATGKGIPPAARELFEEALAKDSSEPRAWFYIALAKAQAGDTQGALADWVALAKASPADAPWLPTVQGHIRQAADRLGIDAPASVPGGPPAAAQAGPNQAAPNQVGPNRADVEAASQMSPSDRTAMVRSMVERLAERLEKNPGDREGWTRLGRSYQVLGETKKAEEAFAKAKALEGQ